MATTTRHDDALAIVADRLARQDAAWASTVEKLATYEGCELHIESAFFQELDDACTLHTNTRVNVGGIRA